MRRTSIDTAYRQRSRRGFTLLELLIVITVLATLASLAIPNYTSARKAANEASAIESMRALVSAQEGYRLAKPSYGVLSDLADSKMLNSALATGSKSSYTFMAATLPDGSTYAFIGRPQGAAGDRWFYVDQSGVIRYRDGDLPDKSSPPLE